MKVAVLAHSFPRYPGDTHGPFVLALSEALAARGHGVHVLVPFDPELREGARGSVRVESFRYVMPDRWHRLGYSRTLERDVQLKLVAVLESPLYFAFAERALRRLVRREGVELIHAHWILPNGFVAARVSAATGVPYCVTLHGSDVFMAERNTLFRRLARRALAGAAHVTSCSAELRERLLEVAGWEHGQRVHLVPNGTDLTPLPPGGHSPVGRRRRRVVTVGRMVDKKGFAHLLEAAPAILERFPDAEIVFGGGGALLSELQDRTERLGLADGVRFTGPLDHDEVLSLMATAEVFVMPSVRDPRGNVDGLPIVVLEAMAAGKPVVASEVSGMPLAVAHGETGLLVPERDPAALAAAVGDLLAAPDRAGEMGRAGRRRVETELNWDAVAAVHDRLYHAVAAHREGRVDTRRTSS